MQYADYEYYQTEYGGKMSVDDYKRFGRRAERRIDGITGNLSTHSFTRKLTAKFHILKRNFLLKFKYIA